MLTAVATGAIVAMVAQALGASSNVAFLACALATGAVQTIRAFLYKQVLRKRSRSVASFSPIRRSLVRGALAALGIFVLSLLRIPRIEAAILDRKLQQATSGSPPYEKANQLVKYAITDNIPINPKTLDTAKRQVTRDYASLTPALQESVKVTFGQLVVYEVYALTGVSLNIPVVLILLPHTYTMHASVFARSVAVVGEDAERSVVDVDFDYDPRLPAVYVFDPRRPAPSGDALVAHLAVGRQRENVFNPPALLAVQDKMQRIVVFDVRVSNLSQTLDDVFWVNVTFDRCRIAYQGGRFRMKSVTFIQCEFSTDNDQARSVLTYIEQHQGEPLTLAIG
jgi:hypothetical protein